MKINIYKSISGLLLVTQIASCSQVETTQPQKKNIINTVFASGYVINDNEYQVTANTEGYLIGRFVDEGSTVNADMPLFQLSNDIQAENLSSAQVNYQDALRKLSANSPERAQLELQIKQANAQMDLDKKNYERYKNLIEKEAVSKIEFEKAQYQYENSLNNVQLKQKALDDFIKTLEVNVKNNKSQLLIQKSANDDYFLTSTIDGIVLKVFKQQGELVRKGETVALIGGGKKIVKLFVAEDDIEELSLEQKVYINLNTQKDKNFQGRITRIYPSFDEIEQSFIVEASFDEAPKRVYHNTQLQANIIIDEIENALVVPSDFIQAGDSIFVEGKGRIKVQLGIRNDQWTQIVDGLDESLTVQKPNQL